MKEISSRNGNEKRDTGNNEERIATNPHGGDDVSLVPRAERQKTNETEANVNERVACST